MEAENQFRILRFCATTPAFRVLGKCVGLCCERIEEQSGDSVVYMDSPLYPRITSLSTAHADLPRARRKL